MTKQKWLGILEDLAADMKKAGTVYGWKSPITEAITLKRSTCVGYVSLALQRAGLMPKGKYIHLSNGRLAGTGLSYVKARPGIFQIKWVRATPQKLGDSLKVGDICLYTVPHIMVYAGKNSKGSPIWYSLERGSGGMGHKVKLTVRQVFGYYTKRKIECIIRLNFADSATKPQTSTNVSKPAKTVKWKLKTAMNMRDKANGSKIICRIPQGAVLTQQSKSGYWIKTTYCGETGWVCCATDKYASKV